ncbi:MAG: outer membrane protein assembly factor BamB [Pseudomonadota bacterium]
MRLSVVLLLMSSLLLGCSNSANKDDKPNELLPLNKQVLAQKRWRATVGSGLGKVYRVMPPAIDSSSVYASDYRGRVFAFDKDSGKQRWRKSLRMALAAGVSARGDQVLVASLDGDIVALNKSTGEINWQVNVTSEILAPPQTNGPVVVVQTNDGKLLGLDSKDGKTLWTYSTQLPVLTLRGTAAPQVLGPNVVAGFANGKIAALSAVDGTLYWERRVARPQGRSDIERVVDIDGTPIVDGSTIYTTSYNGTLSALSPRGQILWSQPTSSHNSPLVIDGTVFVTSAEGRVEAFDARTGRFLWENIALFGRKLSAPQNLSGFLVTADYQGYVHIFDPEVGVVLERIRIDRKGIRSPMVADGTHLYVLGNDGKLASIAVYLGVLQATPTKPEKDS